jgi:sialate O-acetylesterase
VLPLLISDWRKQFNQGELPFIIAQLAGFGALTSNPVESNWAELREAQMATLAVPQTGWR